MEARELQVTFDALDPRALSIFWRDALGYAHPPPPGAELADGDDPLTAWDQFLEQSGMPIKDRNSASALVDPNGVGPRLFFQRVPEGKQVKNRVHLDVRAAPGLTGDNRMDELERECERVIALGATRIRRHDPEQPWETGFIVMADPEGNEFCLD